MQFLRFCSQEWAEMGLPVSTTSDKAARLIDLSIEMVLGVFGTPYEMALAAAEEDKVLPGTYTWSCSFASACNPCHFPRPTRSSSSRSSFSLLVSCSVR